MYMASDLSNQRHERKSDSSMVNAYYGIIVQQDCQLGFGPISMNWNDTYLKNPKI